MNKIIAGVIFGVMVTIPVLSYSVEGQPEVAAPALVEVANKICPVSGEAVDSMGPVEKVEYQGKVYSLCCAMCKGDFDADPAKFVQKVEEQMAKDAQAEQ